MAFNGVVDLPEAQQMLADGMSVRQVAAAFDVSPQAVYELIRRGKLKRPAAASCG
jgi:transposase